jgi:hypothetical protein
MKPTEWEVVSFDYVTRDMHYKTVVMRPCFGVKKKTQTHETREVRLPYQPRVGQIIDLPKLL